MAILSDKDIKNAFKEKSIEIIPFSDSQLGPASVDLSLGNIFKEFKKSNIEVFDPTKNNVQDLVKTVTRPSHQPYVLDSGESVLAITEERVNLSDKYIARIDGRSSWTRLGIMVQTTATFIQPGFFGKISIVITNISKVPVSLQPGTKICQIIFEELKNPSDIPYNKRKDSKYQGQDEPVLSKIYLE